MCPRLERSRNYGRNLKIEKSDVKEYSIESNQKWSKNKIKCTRYIDNNCTHVIARCILRELGSKNEQIVQNCSNRSGIYRSKFESGQ